jgi:hypothetical protein
MDVLADCLGRSDEEGARHGFDVFETLLILVSINLQTFNNDSLCSPGNTPSLEAYARVGRILLALRSQQEL